jgi:hypothetical protein
VDSALVTIGAESCGSLGLNQSLQALAGLLRDQLTGRSTMEQLRQFSGDNRK